MSARVTECRAAPCQASCGSGRGELVDSKDEGIVEKVGEVILGDKAEWFRRGRACSTSSGHYCCFDNQE